MIPSTAGRAAAVCAALERGVAETTARDEIARWWLLGILGLAIVLVASRWLWLLRRRAALRQKLGALQERMATQSAVWQASSRDMRNPLTVIRMAVELLRDGATEAEREHLVRSLARGANQLEHTVDRLLEVAQLDASDGVEAPRSVDLRQWLEECAARHRVGAVAKEIEIAVVCGHPGSAGIAVATVGRILDQLLDNAVVFTPCFGQVEVRAESDPARPGALCFAVLDTGPGFAPVDFERMAAPFQRLSARPTGDEATTGMGLHIATRLAARLGVGLRTENRAEGGAQVSFCVPMLTRLTSGTQARNSPGSAR